MNNAELLAKAKEAVLAVFSDTSVSRDECRDNLDELAADIRGYKDCLDADDAAELAAAETDE